MRRLLKVIIAAVLIFSVITGSTYVYATGDHFSKDIFVNSGQRTFYVDPYNNSTGAVFVINFSLEHYSGGSIAFTPIFTVNSSPQNITETNLITNLTTTTQNGTHSSPYYAIFSMKVMISPAANNPGYGNFNYLQEPSGISGPMGSTGVGTVVVLWNGFSGDSLSVAMSSINIPQGNYNVSVTLILYTHQPPQALLNLKSARAWVNLTSFEIMSHTTFNGVLRVSNLSVSPGN